MCFTPLLFHFADDDLAYENMENTFMFGNAVKVSPVLEAAPKTGDLKIMSYFPKGNWVDLNDMSVLEVDAPKMVELTPGEYPFAHLAPGSIIPFHSNKDMTFTETSQLLEVATPLIANLDDNMQASGALFVDDGISAMGSDSYKPSYVKFQAQAGMVTIFTEMGNEASVLKKAAFMDSITFANAASFASSAAADLYACGLDWNHNVIDFTVAYDTKTTSLKITPAKD
jgi:alpha-glucosidase (family GH31 glycosyl hydrolase)